ncbi:MAG: hypothetical protein ACE5HP_09650 [Gemmatimonadota bacterium]
MRRIYVLRGRFELEFEEPADPDEQPANTGQAESTGTREGFDREPDPTQEGTGEVARSPAVSATVRFGSATASSPFPISPEEGPQAEAATAVTPRTVRIGRGGSVTFEIAPFLQVAIYAPGTNLAAIEVGPGTLETVKFGPFELTSFRINDPRGRLALSPEQTQRTVTWTTPAGTFDQPGRYLAVCTSTPHFVFHRMYGRVIVE